LTTRSSLRDSRPVATTRRLGAPGHRQGPAAAAAPALTLFAVFIATPALASVVLAFTDYSGNVDEPLRFVGLDNFRYAVTADWGDFRGSLVTTAWFAAGVTVAQNLVGLALAVLVNQRIVARNLYRAVFFLPVSLGVVVHGLVWTLVFDPTTGPVQRGLRAVGSESALLGDPAVALPLVIFVVVWANVGNSMVIYLAGMQSVPEEVIAARCSVTSPCRCCVPRSRSTSCCRSSALSTCSTSSSC
jgi:raffinose/stachyose/melibiose transport system permease protein